MKRIITIIAFAAVLVSASSCGAYYGLEKIERIDRETQAQIDRAAQRGMNRINRVYQAYPQTPPQRPSEMQPWQKYYGGSNYRGAAQPYGNMPYENKPYGKNPQKVKINRNR